MVKGSSCSGAQNKSTLLQWFFFLSPVCCHCSNWWERLTDICRVLHNELSHGIESPHSVFISGNLITKFPPTEWPLLKSFNLKFFFFWLYVSQSDNHNSKQLLHLRPFCTHIIILFFWLSVQYSVNYLKYSTFYYKIGFISLVGQCKFSEHIWCFQIVVLEKTLESPLDSKKIKSVNPKGNQLWIFIGRTDAEVKAPIFLPHDVKSWLTGKGPDAGKDWRQKEKRVVEEEMFR